jgi:hypothetical protein
MKIEIGKPAFDALMQGDKPVNVAVEEHEHYRLTIYVKHGLVLHEVESHISLVTQYYAYDINY